MFENDSGTTRCFCKITRQFGPGLLTGGIGQGGQLMHLRSSIILMISGLSQEGEMQRGAQWQIRLQGKDEREALRRKVTTPFI